MPILTRVWFALESMKPFRNATICYVHHFGWVIEQPKRWRNANELKEINERLDFLFNFKKTLVILKPCNKDGCMMHTPAEFLYFRKEKLSHLSKPISWLAYILPTRDRCVRRVLFICESWTSSVVGMTPSFFFFLLVCDRAQDDFFGSCSWLGDLSCLNSFPCS